MEFLIPVFFIALAVAAFLFARSYFARLDRRRITENVMENGGEIIRIEPHSPSRIGNRVDRVYDVEFKTHAGKCITGMCMTSFSSGVIWISEKPPETGMEVSSESQPAGAIQCLQCGTTMSTGTTHCPQCGWSYS